MPARASTTRPRWRRDSSNGNRPVSIASSVLVFVVSGLVGLAIVALGVVYMTRKTATDEAIRDAEQLSAVVGREIVEPVLTDSLLTGDAGALAAVDQVVRNHVIDGAIVRVKLWAGDGTIVYSDEPRLVGERYELKTEDLQALRNPNAPAEADVSDLQRPENVYERKWGKVFEVYLPIKTPKRHTPALRSLSPRRVHHLGFAHDLVEPSARAARRPRRAGSDPGPPCLVDGTSSSTWSG